MKKTGLKFLFFLLLSMVMFASYSQTNCLQAKYELDGNAIDQSGNSLDGVLHGTTPTADRFGNPDSALLFNGTSDYIDLPSDFDYSERTTSLWFKPNDYTTNGYFVFVSDHSGMQYGMTGLYTKLVSTDNQIIHMAGSTSNNGLYSGALTDTWYHAAIVVSATYIKYYINGIFTDSLPCADLNCSANGHSTALIGTSRILDRYFDGAIDDVRIYDCALSDSEIYQMVTDGIDEITNKKTIVISYPNPAKENFSIINPDEKYQDYVLTIKNIQGQTVTEKEINFMTKFFIDVRDFSNGLYFLTLQNQKENYVNKIIIQK